MRLPAIPQSGHTFRRPWLSVRYADGDFTDLEKGRTVASTYDFFTRGDHQAAKNLVAQTLNGHRFTVEGTPSGGYLAKRGSAKKTFWLGAMAGDDFQISFLIEFFVDQQGQLVTRLNRNLAGAAFKGGAIGASKTDTVFVETANALGAVLSGSGLLTGSVSN
jgi:hypothetical protein